MRILLIEDDKLIADAIQTQLMRANYRVEWLSTGTSAISALQTDEFDLVILDLGLPDIDGLTVLKKTRNHKNNTPILILTARESIENRIEGLDYGADDYLTKPFDMDELLARCRALIRRANGRTSPVIKHQELCFDPSSLQVTYNAQPITLSPHATQVLLILLERAGRVVSRADLESALYGWSDSAESNTVEVYISQIRKRTRPDFIRTLRGIGYIIDKVV